MFPASEFPTVEAAIQTGIELRLHTGVQIYVSLACSVVLDSALDKAAPGSETTT